MIDRGKKNILGIAIDAVDYESDLARIFHSARMGRPFTVTALAVHGLTTGALDRQQQFRLNAFDLAVPDGQPVRWALNLLYGAGLKDRVYGPKLTLLTCQEAAKQGVSWQDFQQNMRNQIVTQKVIGEEVGGKLSLNKDEEQQYYDDHKA